MGQKLREYIFCGRVRDWDGTDSYRMTVIVLFLLLLPVFFGRLGDNTLLKTDELLHAAMATDILKTGDWFTMHYNGEPSWLKPPLYFWVEAVFFRIFGQSEFWARFPSAAAGYGTLFLVYAIGTRICDRKTGLLGMVVLATSFFFLKYSRRAMLDVPVAFATTLGVYAIVRGEKEGRYDLLFGLAVAAGYYIKAVQGLYVAVIGPLYLIISGQWKRLIRPSMLAAYAAAAALIAAWVWPQISVHGPAFIYSQSGISPIIHRGAVQGMNMPFYVPLLILSKVYWPWLPACLFGMFLLARRGTRDRAALLIFTWVGIILLSLMISSSVFERYMLTIVPAISLCGGIALSRWVEDDKLCEFTRVTAAVIIFFVLIGTCTPIKLDRSGHPQNDLARTINYIVPAERPILNYRGLDWATMQGLNFYAGRYLDKQINSVEDLTRERMEREGKLYCIVSSEDFVDIENSGMKDQVRFLARTGPYGRSRIQYFLVEILPSPGVNSLLEKKHERMMNS
ncbi:MAG: glycosyltransferase family 39 protein [Nitrospirota bacterium]